MQAKAPLNWQSYLPPQQQQIIFFPDLWTDAERESWGQTLLLPGSN
ncbi:hypothetical protein [Spirosoma linguale]